MVHRQERRPCWRLYVARWVTVFLKWWIFLHVCLEDAHVSCLLACLASLSWNISYVVSSLNLLLLWVKPIRQLMKCSAYSHFFFLQAQHRILHHALPFLFFFLFFFFWKHKLRYSKEHCSSYISEDSCICRVMSWAMWISWAMWSCGAHVDYHESAMWISYVCTVRKTCSLGDSEIIKPCWVGLSCSLCCAVHLCSVSISVAYLWSKCSLWFFVQTSKKCFVF